MVEKNTIERPKVGVGVLVFKDGKVLLGKRKGSHGAGEYAAPGGHLEHLESIQECVRREVYEETGIEIQNIKFLCLSNVTIYAPKHYIDIGVVCEWKSGEPEALEPHKIEGWDWYDTQQLPEPIFEFVKNYFTALKTGQVGFLGC